ncbi:MAG: hypothetical protein QOE90_1837 [Thermoplasmata archaeon]|jgi:hypothetical protein|nr:hypothetical protein [Thermoplasmata archaeon]
MAEGKRGDANEVLRQAVAIFERAGLAFTLVGATAYGLRTLPRATYDLDFVVEDRAPALDGALRDFFIDSETHDPVFDQRAMVLEVPTFVTPVEVFVATHWLAKSALLRRVTMRAGDLALPVATPEDLLLMKAATAAHPSRPRYKRATDLADMGALLDADLGLDRPYLLACATRLGVVDVLRECGLDLHE